MKLSIRSKIILICTSVFILAIAASATVSSFLFTKEYTRAIQTETFVVARTLKHRLDPWLNRNIPIGDLSGFDAVCRDFVEKNVFLSYAMIVDPDGRILFHNDPGQRGRLLPDNATRLAVQNQDEILQIDSRDETNFFDFVIPVQRWDGRKVASVRVGFPTKVVHLKTAQLVMSSVLVASAILILGIIALVFSLDGWVSKPISRLLKVIEDIRENGTGSTQLVEMNSRDEVGHLASAFNQMVGELQESQELIRRHTDELELKVQERTAELRVANEQLERDIEDRKDTAEEIRRLSQAVDQSIDGIVIADLKERIIYVNVAMAEMFGYEPDEMLGMSIRDLYRKEHRIASQKGTDQLRNQGSWRGETIHTRKDGTTFPAFLSATLLNDDAGKPSALLAVLRDVSEQNHLKEQLAQAQKMEAIGTLAGGVAHDLNNILSGLVSYPELILMDMPEDSPLYGPVRTIQKSGQKAAAIVQDLLTLARRGVETTDVVNLNQIVAEYLISPEFERLKSFHPLIRMETDLAGDLLCLLGSPVHLFKSIMNLVSNAAEAMPQEGKIHIATENRYVDRPIQGYNNVKEGDYVVLTVSDTGTGISIKDHRRIFEPFYTKKVMGRSGTGLGMTVVWGTVQDHRGYIDVQSVRGKGTTFTIYFPATRRTQMLEQLPSSAEKYVGQGESILVVDDVPEQREIASSILSRLGYSVSAVASGEAAVEHIEENETDLVVLDMIMPPGIDGFETFRRLRERHPEQKAIITSGFSETERVRAALEMGAGTYLKKPYLLEKFGMAIKTELQRPAAS